MSLMEENVSGKLKFFRMEYKYHNIIVFVKIPLFTNM